MLPEFLSKQNIEYSEVDVIRMDTEGYEYEILVNSKPVFDSIDKLILQNEIHPFHLSPEELSEIIKFLENFEAEILSSHYGENQNFRGFTQLFQCEIISWII